MTTTITPSAGLRKTPTLAPVRPLTPRAGRSCRGWPAIPVRCISGGVLAFRVESFLDDDTVGGLDELNLDLPAVAHAVLDFLLGHDTGIGAFEVESFAPVLGFHARQELAALAKVDGRSSRRASHPAQYSPA